MKLTVVIFFASMMVSLGNVHGQRVSLDYEKGQFKRILVDISKQSGYTFIYDEKDLSSITPVSVVVENGHVVEALDILFQGKSLQYQIKGKSIAIKRISKSREDTQGAESILTAQNRTIKGRVVDESGEPLSGVSVTMKDTNKGTSTDSDGMYEIIIPAEHHILVFNYLGFTSREIRIDGQSEILVTLKEYLADLDEVVVVGFGTQRKVNLTGAVEQIKGDVLENRPITNIAQGLQGVVPNLNLVPSDGKPTGAPEFNIRGTTSIGSGGSALVLVDGVEGDPSLLNPNDIESVSILKDAASAAVYGARAAFGVVLITTKNPTTDRVNVTYSSNFSSKSPTAMPDYVTNGYQWASMFNEAFSAWDNYSTTPQNVNKTLRFSPEYLEELKRRDADPSLPKVEVDPNTGEYVYYGSTDWYSELYKKNTSAQEHNISITGGSEKVNFYITGRLMGQNGIFRYNSDDFSMHNIRAKGSIKLFPWLTVNNNTDFSNVKYHNPLNVGESGGIWRNIADEGHPMSAMFNPDGTLTHSAAYTVGDFWYGKNGIDTDRRLLRNTTSIHTSFFDNKLRVNTDFTLQQTDNNEKRIRVPVPYSRIPGVVEYVGLNYNDIREIFGETQYLASNTYAEYEETVGKHYLKGMAGYNYELSTHRRLSSQQNGLIFENADDISLALGQSFINEGGWDQWNVMGVFFRLNYSFDNRYLVEVNGRYDGSSKFPENERFAFFPSISAGWRISEEPFWKIPSSIISDFKIRGSYGSLGNGNINSYQFMELLSVSQSARILDGVRPQTTRNPAVIPHGLTWETSTTQNIGIDAAFWSNKLVFNADAYIRKTTDMFTRGITLPAVFGAESPKGNYADLKTRGWEASLSFNDRFLVKDKDLSYSIRLVASDYIADILKYNNPEKRLDDYYVGQRVGEIWGYETLGFFTSQADIEASAQQNIFRSTSTGAWAPGDIKFRDINNDGVIDNGDNTVDSPGDRRIIGNAEPRYRFGINIGADWSNFFFSVFFQGVGKQNWYPSAEANTFWGQYNRPYGDPLVYQLENIWTEDNPNAYFPRYRSRLASNAQGTLTAAQTRYLQNVAYIRVKNIQFGYNLPSSVLSKLRMQNARVFISGENLWTYSPMYKLTRDIDVESIRKSDEALTGDSNYGDAYNYPILKSFSVGLSVTF